MPCQEWHRRAGRVWTPHRIITMLGVCCRSGIRSRTFIHHTRSGPVPGRESWTSPQVHEVLARRGVLVREYSAFAGLEPGNVISGPDGQMIPTRGHLRFAVRTRAENDRLLTSLAEILGGESPTALEV